MAFCPRCGAAVQDGVSFCGNCGAALRGQASPQLPNATSQELPIAENVVGALAYFVLPSIVFLFIDPYRRNFFVRFHSLQCLFTTAAMVVCAVALSLASTIVHLIPYIGVFLVLLAWPLFALAGFLLWLLVVYKAYQHELFKLPYVGDMAERHAAAV